MNVEQFEHFSQFITKDTPYGIYSRTSNDGSELCFSIKKSTDMDFDAIWISEPMLRDQYGHVDYDAVAASITMCIMSHNLLDSFKIESIATIVEGFSSPKLIIRKSNDAACHIAGTVELCEAIRHAANPVIKTATHGVKISENEVDLIQITVDGTQTVKPGLEFGLDTIKMPNGLYGRADMNTDQYGAYDAFIVEISDTDEESKRRQELIDERNDIIERVNELWYINENDHWLKAAKLIARINTLNTKLRELEHKMILKRIQSANDETNEIKNQKPV